MGKNLIGPFTIDVKVSAKNASEGQIGAITVGLAPGQIPTEEAIKRAIGQALSAMPDGWSLLSGDEFFNKVLVREKTGRVGNFAVPAGFRFDAKALAAECVALVPDDEQEPDEDDDDHDDDFDDEDFDEDDDQ